MDVSSYIGMPFKPRGRDRDGCDCWGLARIIYHDVFDLELPSLQYAEKFDIEELMTVMAEEAEKWVKIERGKEKPGDILVLRSLNPHVGIVIKKGKMIHIQKSTAACIERYTATAWNRRIMGIYRHAELA